jgi:hypothetical protein
MAQKNKALIVLGSLVVIGSVGYYLFSKSKKGSKGEGSLEPTPNDSPTPSPTPTPNVTPKPIVGKTYNVKDYLNSSDAIKKFQDWMDANHPNWVNGKNLNKGSGYGTHIGKNTQKAWNNHSAEYVALLERQNQSASTRAAIEQIRKRLPKGKNVLATTTFRAFAQELRNGQWFPTDSVGNQLPSKEFKVTSSVGRVFVVLNDGMVIVQVAEALRSNLSNKDFYLIKVNPNWIR